MPSRQTQLARPNSRSRYAHECVSAVWFAATALAVFAACDTPGVTLIDPDFSGGEDRSLTVTVHLEDSSLARALGWSDGVPDAKVVLNRVGDQFDPITLLTDSNGTVVLNMILPGQYRIAAQRVLQAGETTPTEGAVRAFGDGLTGGIGPPQVLGMQLQIDQAGALVFSEVYPVYSFFTDRYQAYQFFELYNNADTTIFLDGMIWGSAWDIRRAYTTYPCEATEQWGNDPLGLWARFFHRFPGTGREYPVHAGEAVTVALDAADHSAVNQAYPDLSRADFELEGDADIDNPDVPNMPQVGPGRWFRGSGLEMKVGMPWFLSLPLDSASLLHRRDPFWGHDWVRIPNSALLDVALADIMLPVNDVPYPPCSEQVPHDLDALPAAMAFAWSETSLSMQRVILGTAQAGQAVLQDLNVSFLDFVESEITPGTIRP